MRRTAYFATAALLLTFVATGVTLVQASPNLFDDEGTSSTPCVALWACDNQGHSYGMTKGVSGARDYHVIPDGTANSADIITDLATFTNTVASAMWMQISATANFSVSPTVNTVFVATIENTNVNTVYSIAMANNASAADQDFRCGDNSGGGGVNVVAYDAYAVAITADVSGIHCNTFRISTGVQVSDLDSATCDGGQPAISCVLTHADKLQLFTYSYVAPGTQKDVWFDFIRLGNGALPPAVAPTVETLTVTDVRTSSAVVTGRLTNYGTGYEVLVSADSSPGGAQVCISNCGPFTNGTDALPQTFVIKLTGLVDCTAHTGWALANALAPFQHSEGAHLNFTTKCAAHVATADADDIQPTSARFRGSVTVADTNEACVHVFFQWGSTTGLGNETVRQLLCGLSSFSQTMYGQLRTNTTYYFRAAVNGTEYEAYGATLNFTTAGGSQTISAATPVDLFNAICVFAFVFALMALLVGAFVIKRKRGGGLE